MTEVRPDTDEDTDPDIDHESFLVEKGTAVQLQQFGDVYAKTGTAEFTADDGATHAHAWTVGYRGDLAFAALIVGGEDSVHTNEILERFLTAVPR